MSTSSEGFWQRRSLFGIYELLQTWWRHRVSFILSIAITLAALTLYYFTFLGEKSTPLFAFLQRFEYNSLDTRFRYRPSSATPPDARIVIVDIDQQSQEVLGKWPFSRKHFASMLDVLRNDGAKVVSFDITFDQPDRTADPLRDLLAKLEERKKRGEAIDPKLESEVRALVEQYDADTQFAKAIDRFGPVVLGNFFLKPDELKGIDPAILDQYDELIEWYALGRNALQPQTGKEDFLELVARYRRDGDLYAANVANIPALANPDKIEKTTVGFFNVSSDADGVLRRTMLVLPFGRSNDILNWQLFGSLEVQTMRLYLGLHSDQVIVQYDPTGVVRIDFGTALLIKTDSTGHLSINYHGPRKTYPYKSIADVVQHKCEPGTFKDKIVLVGASATGIADLRTPPYGEIDYPGVEIHANVIDNMLHQNFLVRGM